MGEEKGRRRKKRVRYNRLLILEIFVLLSLLVALILLYVLK